MARGSKPWWWSERKKWFVHLNKQRYCLGEHPEDAPKPRKGKLGWNPPSSILEAFQKLRKDPLPTDTVESILFDFCQWCFANKAPRTAKGYKEFCEDFSDTYGSLRISALSPIQVDAWISTKPWGPTSTNNAITALKRAFNWAVKHKGLTHNPIHAMEKPKVNHRTTIVTPAEFSTLLTHIKPKDPFYDLVVVSYDVGLRPQEVKQLEARHLQLDKGRAVLPATEAKGRKRARAIYFATKRSLAIVRRLAKLRPTGLLFLNRRGTPWNGMNIHCRFSRLKAKTGVKISHYSFRHGWITRKLWSGVDSHVVAKLAGHASTKMIDFVYSHIADDHAYMLAQARR